MKKHTSMILLLSLLLLLCSCASEEQGPEPPKTVEYTTSATETTDAPTEPPTVPTEAPTVSETVPVQTPVTFTEQGIADNDFCRIRITGIDPDSIFGYTLFAELENKSTDQVLTFSVADSSVNGIKNDIYFNEDVEPGSIRNTQMIFRNKEISQLIGEFTDIEFSWSVIEKGELPTKPLAADTVHIYPMGEENAVRCQRLPEPGDIVLLDNDKLSVTLTGYSADDAFGFIVSLYTVNKLTNSIFLGSEDETLNGTEAAPYFAASIPGNCGSFDNIVWPRKLLEEKGITSVETLSFRLLATNAKNLFDSYADVPIHLEPDFQP